MQKEELNREVGLKIRGLRESKNLSIQKLSDKIDIEYSNMIRIEKGRTNPTIWTLYKICQGLEINLVELVGVE